VSTLVLRALATDADAQDAHGAERRRELWAAAGVLVDELSGPALTLGLPGDPRTASGRALGACTEAGQPAYLTLRQLVRDPPSLRVGRCFYVCENPADVAAAADRLGAGCRPLVCLSGQPGAATASLLRRLVAGGAEPRWHADFDWGGVRIVSGVRRRLRGQAWRYGTADYRAARATRTAGRPLSGRPAQTAWDPALAAAMRADGQRVEEEAVLDSLLADLAG
jgi:uncharacterized protein (TIGR02679 family)